MPSTALVVITSCEDNALAQAIAQSLVELGLAACVQLMPGIVSFYRWEDELCQSQEVQLQIKCLAANYDAVAAHILKLHTYDVPEIIALPITQGLDTYLQWIKDTSQS